jgi:hypothetical protein
VDSIHSRDEVVDSIQSRDFVSQMACRV